MFIATLFTISQTKKKKPRYPATNAWMNYITSIHWNKEEWTINAVTSITIRCIRLNESSHTQKATCYMIPFIWHFGKGKKIRSENRSLVAGGWDVNKEALGTIGSESIVLCFDCGGDNCMHCQNSLSLNFISLFLRMETF